MTSTQEKFADALVKTDGDARAAYLSLNPEATENSLRTSTSRMLNNPEVKQRVRRILDEEGITLEHCARKHKKFLNRTNGTGLKALELAYKLHGALDDESKNVPISLENIEICISQQVLTHSENSENVKQNQHAPENISSPASAPSALDAPDSLPFA